MDDFCDFHFLSQPWLAPSARNLDFSCKKGDREGEVSTLSALTPLEKPTLLPALLEF